METFPDDVWDTLSRAPSGELHPDLLAELMKNGQQQSALQFATILQKAVRYGQASDFVIRTFNVILFILCEGDMMLVKGVSDLAQKTIEEQELEYHKSKS